MLIIPFAELDKDTLRTLLEEIVTRDGTDYGAVEMTTTQKIEQALWLLQNGRVCLCFDHETESCNLLSADEARRLAE